MKWNHSWKKTFWILKKKLNLYHHIVACLSPDTIVHQILQSQERLKLNGLHSEIEHFLIKHEISDVRRYSKTEWRALVKRKIEMDNREFLIESAMKYKKIDYLEMACEEYGMKEYFLSLDLYSSRIRFMERASCMPLCMSHQPSNQKYIDRGFICLCNEKKVDTLHQWRALCRLRFRFWVTYWKLHIKRHLITENLFTKLKFQNWVKKTFLLQWYKLN